ncbi:MAG: c-type cytochrome [Hydrogenophaga sp.]
MKPTRYATLILATAVLSTPAMAQFQKPEDAIKYRKAGFTLMATHVGRVGAMVNGRVPFDAKVAADNAAVAETLSRLPWAAFGPGTEKGDTRALPVIWTDQGAFKEAGEKMQAEMVKLVAATKTGNLDSVKLAFGAVGQTCKACHDNFRKD